MEHHFRVRSIVKLIFRPNLLQVEHRQKRIHNLFLLAQEIFELKVILNNLVSPSLNVVKERARVIASVAALGLLQEVHAVL